MKRVVQIYESFEDAEQAERDYYVGLTPDERLDILFELRARHEAMLGPKKLQSKPGLSVDMREFVESFNARGVEYAIVGGFAAAYYGYPRYTGDINFFVRQDRDNLTKVLDALAAFGLPLSMTVATLLKPDVMVKIGEPPNRIDVLTSIDGVTFDAVWAGRVAGKLDGLPVAFIGREELLANKRAANRPKDQADVAELEARAPRQQRRPKKAAGRRPKKR